MLLKTACEPPQGHAAQLRLTPAESVSCACGSSPVIGVPLALQGKEAAILGDADHELRDDPIPAC